MDRETSSTTQYQPVTVDVPEDRVAEFHAFFARFLAGRTGRGRGGRASRHHDRHGQRVRLAAPGAASRWSEASRQRSRLSCNG